MENPRLVLEAFTFTIDQFKYAEIEKNYYESLSARAKEHGGINGKPSTPVSTPLTPDNPCISHIGTTPVSNDYKNTNEVESLSLSEQVARAREHVKASLGYNPTSASNSFLSSGGVTEDPKMREENALLRKKVELLEEQVKKLTNRVADLEVFCKEGNTCSTKATSAPVPAKPSADSKKVEDDDDVDLFASGDEEEDADAAAMKAKVLAEYAAKKAKKPALVAKSNVILDVKPWDDETDMKKLEEAVRSIEMEGLLWGVSKLVPVGYGIKKLQIATVVEDEKVSIDELTEKIEGFEEFVQSVDIAAFNKI